MTELTEKQSRRVTWITRVGMASGALWCWLVWGWAGLALYVALGALGITVLWSLAKGFQEAQKSKQARLKAIKEIMDTPGASKASVEAAWRELRKVTK